MPPKSPSATQRGTAQDPENQKWFRTLGSEEVICVVVFKVCHFAITTEDSSNTPFKERECVPRVVDPCLTQIKCVCGMNIPG